MFTIVLIRPGCTDYDEQHRIQGSLDLPLNERGEAQLEEIIQQVAETEVDAIITSPSEPAKSTAVSIATQLGLTLKESEGLRNLDQGLWEGLPVEEVRRKFPKVFKQWKESPETICPPEGETISVAVDRVRKVLEKPLKKKKSVAIVASEPLATLISCAVRGSRPEFEDPSTGNASGCLVEVIETNGSLPSNNSTEVQNETAEAVTGSKSST